ncbi:MAG: M48 family metalloprotease [Acidobacteria bacterium]|nr:M48 family metalloprotease [Acidobacteriota bacterium]MBS1864527.1 M48 family metalloprotease [Acidobacteriota bacterium]
MNVFRKFLRMAFWGVTFLTVPCIAQQACPPPQIPAPDPKKDIFSDKQEMDLGDAIAEQLQRSFLVIDDEDLTGYVQHIGQKLLAQAPPTGLQLQFFLYDSPEANAETMPGGRVYVSRKLVAMTRNEDELASVLGHELGHVLTHQPAIRLTQWFRDALGVTQPGTREEIFHSYELLQESVVRKKKAFQRSGGEKDEQGIADQVGIQLIVRAGYSAKAFGDFFDRLADTKGKTGNWLSDLVGTTKPDAKRLREILKQTPALTAACAVPANTSNPIEFQKWQASVVSYSGLGHKEQLHGVFSKTTLNPPLQSDMRQVRYSPDGKYILAQDESTIFVMTREPFAAYFTIFAPDALPASFTPDSQSIIFYTDSLRVESWSIADKVRTSVNEMTIPHGCIQTEISPNGKYLACYGEEFDLSLYEVGSNDQVFHKKDFYEPHSFREFIEVFLARLLGGSIHIVEMHFSPEERYLLAGAMGGSPTLGVDLSSMQTISMPGSVKALLVRHFAFLGPDRIVGVDPYYPKNSGIVKFPSGESVTKLQLGDQRIDIATNPRYLLLRPIKEHPVGVIDLETQKIIIGSDRNSIDIFGENYVRERIDGDLGMVTVADQREVGRVKLPLGQLGHLSAFAISPNLRWMAISEKSRGGVWDLLQSKRIFYVRGFTGASVSAEGTVDADFSKFQETKRSMAHMDTASGQIEAGMEIDEMQISQKGSVLLRTTHKGKDDWKPRNIELAALDAKTGAVLWKRDYPKEAPSVASIRSEGNLVFFWPANSDGTKLEIKNDATLSQRWQKMDANNEDYFLEVVEPRSGKILGSSVVRTGKGAFRMTVAESSGDWLVVSDSKNRLLVYSMKTGEQTGILFGRRPVISGPMSLLTCENERGQLALYDLNTLARREQYVFTSPIAYSYFAADNRRLFVLTGNQAAYFIMLPRADAKSANVTTAEPRKN